jgi:hypothetical protein
MRGVRMRATVVWAVIGVYAFAVGVHVMPNSAIRRALVRPADAIAVPLLAQRWNLFAPVPATANLSTYMLVHYKQDGVLHTSRLIDLSTLVRHAATSRRWAPTRLTRVLTKYNVAFEAQARADEREAVERHIDLRVNPPAWFADEVARRRARYLIEYGRVLSAAAPAGVPAGAAIVSVRGLVIRTPVVPFSRRHEKQAAPKIALADPDAPARLLQPNVINGAGTMVVFDSGWMGYDAHVARMPR